jgi:hypothetical protein
MSIASLLTRLANAVGRLCYQRALQRPEIVAAANYWPGEILVTSVCHNPSDEELLAFTDTLRYGIARYFTWHRRYPTIHRHSPEMVAALAAGNMPHHPFASGVQMDMSAYRLVMRYDNIRPTPTVWTLGQDPRFWTNQEEPSYV